MDQEPVVGDPIAAPLAVIVDVVGRLEPGLDAAAVGAVVEQVAPSRRKRRQLATVLLADSAVLTDGRSSMPRAVEELVRALLVLGATSVALPHCGECGKASRLHGRRGPQRICGVCASRQAICGRCGQQRRVAYRDRRGRPRCKGCPPEGSDEDVVAAVLAVIARLDPTVPVATATEAIWRAAPSRIQRRRLWWALEDAPELLSGAGARGPRVVLGLIEELARVGTAGVVRPACPACGRIVRLYEPVEGQRLCRRCHSARRVVPRWDLRAVWPAAALHQDHDRPAALRDMRADGRAVRALRPESAGHCPTLRWAVVQHLLQVRPRQHPPVPDLRPGR